MSPETGRIDVAQIMRRIREETRAHQAEIDRRIDKARRQFARQVPEIAEDRLRRMTERLNELFDRYYAQTAEFLVEQEPNYENIRGTLVEINRLIEYPDPPRGQRDRWWNPWFWVKRAIAPLRRYVLRQQYDLNAVMRDTLIYLVNHTAHLHAQRATLEMGVDSIHLLNALLGRDGVLPRYFEEWPGISLNVVLEYINELLEQKVREFERLTGERVDEVIDNTAARLNHVERRIAAVDPRRAGAVVGFDNLCQAMGARGEEESIRGQQQRYIKYLEDLDLILDAGCGRGEFLELLKASRIRAYGVDSDPQMVAWCKEKGLDAREADALDHLATLPDNSLGGIVALQVIEHLDFASLVQFLREARRTIRPGGVIILETVNPTCLTVYSGAMYADPTHQRPIHPEAARQLLEMAGFSGIAFEYLRPVDPDKRLYALEDSGDPKLAGAIETLNRNFERLNSVLYGHADYAAIGKKPVES